MYVVKIAFVKLTPLPFSTSISVTDTPYEASIKNGTTKIQIIYEKPQLKAIFEGIVKNYAMRYCS